MSESQYHDGILRFRAEDTTRTVTTYDAAGTVTNARPYTPAENAQADARIAALAARAAREADRLAVRDILDSINASIDESQAQRLAAIAYLDQTAPTTVPQMWTATKALARIVRDTDSSLIAAVRSVRKLAKYAAN